MHGRSSGAGRGAAATDETGGVTSTRAAAVAETHNATSIPPPVKRRRVNGRLSVRPPPLPPDLMFRANGHVAKRICRSRLIVPRRPCNIPPARHAHDL